MSVSVWTHIPQDQPDDQQYSFRVLISMNYNLIIPLLNSDHLVLLWQIDGKIWESMARDREVSGMSTEGSSIQTFIDKETDTFSSTK